MSAVGGSPAGVAILGLLERSLALETAGASPVVALASAVVVGAGVVAELVPVEAEPESLLSLPHPAASRARAASGASRRTGIMRLILGNGAEGGRTGLRRRDGGAHRLGGPACFVGRFRGP